MDHDMHYVDNVHWTLEIVAVSFMVSWWHPVLDDQLFVVNMWRWYHHLIDMAVKESIGQNPSLWLIRSSFPPKNWTLILVYLEIDNFVKPFWRKVQELLFPFDADVILWAVKAGWNRWLLVRNQCAHSHIIWVDVWSDSSGFQLQEFLDGNNWHGL